MVVSLSGSDWFTLTNSIPKNVVDDAVRFHGHLGPFLILGLKAGLYANKVLGKDCFRTNTIVETELNPPCSCFVDGIQFITGCTMGKRNVELRNGRFLSAIFIKDGKKLRLSLKSDILQSLKKPSSKKSSENIAMDLSKRHVQELFDIEESPNKKER